MISGEKNPFANPDGSPQKGKEFEYLDWSIQRDKERISKLSTEGKKREIKASNHLKDKMES